MLDYVKNILNVYKTAVNIEERETRANIKFSQPPIVEGRNWYKDARKKAQEIADEHELPLHVVVGVIAALSPTNKWEKNVIDANTLIACFIEGGYVEDVKVSTYNTMKMKAWSILNCMGDYEVIAKILNGPKITDFYRCIMGENVCVIDGHAWCIANNDRRVLQEVPNIGKGLRVELQQAYKKAAEKHGIKAYEMQAITWVAWKRIHNI